MLVKAIAPAKINLGLLIKGKRADNYHEIDTIMQSVNLCDTIKVRDSMSGDISIKCEKSIGCSPRENIVYKIAEEFFKCTGIINPGISVEIEKNIPVCAGLAGGSSDGAAVLRCLDRIFSAGLSEISMQDIGAKIGADIPFCISGGTARAYGTGTKIDRVKSLLGYAIVIVKPYCDVSTKKAYEMYDILGTKTSKSIDNMIDLINKQDVKGTASYLFNEFEELIDNNEIKKVKKIIKKSNPLGVCMSGSGPSVFAVFRTIYEARFCADMLRTDYTDTYVCEPIPYGAKILDVYNEISTS